MTYAERHAWRFKRTIEFLKTHAPPPAKVLDLGTENPFTPILKEEGYDVTNTTGEDLDIDFDIVRKPGHDLVTAFEIFEHMVAPFNVLRSIEAKTLVASVPLALWFDKAYWSEMEAWDRHYHEFEDRQFNMVLEKAGWKVIHFEKWSEPLKKIGVRPFLRNITPRYYIVHCKRG